MREKQFVVELKNKISETDFISLRTLYSPLIGLEAVMVYSIINDYYYINNKEPIFTPIKYIADALSIPMSELMKAKAKLEAVGLLRTFVHSDEIKYIFRVNNPLTPQAFKNNKMLFEKCLSKISEVHFEKIYFSMQINELQKDEFAECTIKYQDVFENVPQKPKQTTLEMQVANFDNIDDAKKGLLPMQFVHYLTNKKATPSQIALFQRISNTALSSESINEIISYSYDINNKIVGNHIETIVRDLLKKGINNIDHIIIEMNNAREGLQSKKVSPSDISTSQLELTKDDEFISNQTEASVEWENIFDKLGGEL